MASTPEVWELPHDVAIEVLMRDYAMTGEGAEEFLASALGYGGRDLERVADKVDVEAARGVVRQHLARRGNR